MPAASHTAEPARCVPDVAHGRDASRWVYASARGESQVLRMHEHMARWLKRGQGEASERAELTDSAWRLYADGMASLSRRRFDEAISSFRRAVEIDPKHADAWVQLAGAYGEMAQLDQALDAYEQLLTLRPKDMKAWWRKANLLESLQRWDVLLDTCEHLLALRPRDASAWIEKGLALFQMGRHEDGLAAWSRAATLNPQNPRAWTNSAYTLDRLGRYEEEVAVCERAVYFLPRDADILMRLS